MPCRNGLNTKASHNVDPVRENLPIDKAAFENISKSAIIKSETLRQLLQLQRLHSGAMKNEKWLAYRKTNKPANTSRQHSGGLGRWHTASLSFGQSRDPHQGELCSKAASGGPRTPLRLFLPVILQQLRPHLPNHLPRSCLTI